MTATPRAPTRAALVAAGALAAASEARAGDGPWALSQDDRSVYFGAAYTRWSRFAGGEGSFVGEPTDVGTSVTRTDVGGQLTYGLLPGSEFEVGLAYAWSGVSRFDAAPCDVMPDGPCATVSGLAPPSARLKILLLDEFAGRPVSAAFGPTFRFGDFTRADRHRITAIGDGQTDLGGFLAVGRTGGLGSWSYAAFAEGGFRYRLGVGTVGGHKVPGDEWDAALDVLVQPRNELAVGLAVDLLVRPVGVDFEEIDVEDPDRFTSLSVTSLKAGPKLIVKSIENTSFVVSSLFSVYGRNNPVDAWTLGVGVGRFVPSRSRVGGP